MEAQCKAAHSLQQPRGFSVGHGQGMRATPTLRTKSSSSWGLFLNTPCGQSEGRLGSHPCCVPSCRRAPPLTSGVALPHGPRGPGPQARPPLRPRKPFPLASPASPPKPHLIPNKTPSLSRHPACPAAGLPITASCIALGGAVCSPGGGDLPGPPCLCAQSHVCITDAGQPPGANLLNCVAQCSLFQ